MRWVNLSFVSTLVLSPLSWSQEAPQAVLKLLQEHQKRIPFKAKFVQIKTMKEMGVELKSEGELEVKKVSHAVWTLRKPAFLRVELSPEDIKITSELGAAPRIIKKEGSLHLQDGDWMRLFMEKPEELLSQFDVTQLSPRTFQLAPKLKTQGFESVELRFSSQAKISEIFINESKDDTLRMTFSEKGR